jgi:hypothetical protein
MSYWSHNLTESPWDLQDSIRRAKNTFDCLAMRVPRSWWEPYLRRGKPRKDHVGVLRILFNDLKNCPELQERINYSLLVAIAFLDDEARPSFSIQPSQQSVEEYVAAAEKLLAERPDVRRLGKVITDVANALPEKGFTL